MNNTFTTANFGTDNIDYDLATKLNVFTGFAVIYCRVLEHREEKDEALWVCDGLLEKQLPPHQRKSFDTIKARITKQAAAAGGGGKGGKDAPAEISPTE